MEKKVRYLMLLLCLFLFPFRVYALESEIPENENNNESNVVVEKSNNENIIQNSDSKEAKEENDEENLEELDNAEKDTNVPQVGETSEEEKKEEENNNEEKKENPDENDTTIPEGNVEKGLRKAPIVGITAPVTEISSVTITGATLDLVGGEDISFTAASGETDKYTLVREEWYSYGSLYASSTASENLPAVVGDVYDYSFVIALQDGYMWAGSPDEDGDYEVTVLLNGTSYDGYATPLPEEGSNVYLIDPFYWTVVLDSSLVYVDDLELVNAVLTPYVGQAPLFGASTNNEHFTVWAEAWEYSAVVGEDEDGSPIYDSFYNISNPETYDPSQMNLFSTFESGNEYTYMFLLKAEQGYRIKNKNGASNFYFSHPFMINGTEYTVFGYSYEDTDGNIIYYFEINGEFQPIEPVINEVTENANPTITQGEAPDVTIGISGDFTTFDNVYLNGTLVEETNYETSGDAETTKVTFLASFLNTLAQGVHNIVFYFKNGNLALTDLTVNAPATTTTNTSTSSPEVTYVLYDYSTGIEETKLEVKKDKKDTEKKETEKEEKTSSNLGLIIFLIILVTIAIAIPVTVYRKKQ